MLCVPFGVYRYQLSHCFFSRGRVKRVSNVNKHLRRWVAVTLVKQREVESSPDYEYIQVTGQTEASDGFCRPQPQRCGVDTVLKSTAAHTTLSISTLNITNTRYWVLSCISYSPMRLPSFYPTNFLLEIKAFAGDLDIQASAFTCDSIPHAPALPPGRQSRCSTIPNVVVLDCSVRGYGCHPVDRELESCQRPRAPNVSTT